MSEGCRPEAAPLKIVLISGMSGAGKTLALKALEDLEYFAIDNLPCRLVDPLVLLLEQNREIGKVALVMDGRDPAFPESAESILAGLRGRGHQVTLLFLDASHEVLIRRFAETRRPHPMARGASVEKGVTREAEMLRPIRRLASQVLDTTDFNVHRFRAAIVALVEKDPGQSLGLVIASFGFKYGIPLEAAFVFDVRYLPNPFFVDELRTSTGLDARVAAYVFREPAALRIARRIAGMVEDVLPLCRKEGRSNLMVAVGCTGGQHRSVAIAERVARSLRRKGIGLSVLHRDLNRG